MRWTSALPRRLAVVAAGLMLASLAASVVGTAGPDEPRPEPAKPAPAAEPAPLFAATEPAANAPVLVLHPDGSAVHGWVAGETSFAGKTVNIEVGPGRYQTTVLADNTFTWQVPKPGKLRDPDAGPQPAPEPRTATFTIPGGGPAASVALSEPAAGRETPSVFFVTDRSAYRPGHTLKFAAFLRHLRADGEFEPVPDHEVTVDLTSEAKRTRAARLKLRSDSFGRIMGSYTFSDADSLDHYTLTADGFAGTARVMLGEYRKSKVGLKIRGEVKDGKLALTFDARDFLDRPVKGLDASFTAQVTRQTESFARTLDPAKFAHPEAAPPSAGVADGLPDDERLLALAHGVSAMTFAGLGGRVVAHRDGKVAFATDGPGKVELDLNPDWLKGGHAVSVTGMLLDETGRENRASAVVNLDPVQSRGVKVTVPREMIAAGEKLRVTVEPFGLTDKDAPATTLIVVRLDPNPGSPWATPAPDSDGEYMPDNTRLPAIGGARPAKKPEAADGWKPYPVFDPVKRRFVNVLPVAAGAVEPDLRQPGAYKLLAVTRLADGTVLHGEAGVVVKAPAKLPAVVLKLDEKEVRSGARLRGVVQTRFAGARMLLTLRDSTGVRLAKTITASKAGVATFDEPLPPNLRYGCAVTVQYPESAAVAHADQRELFVVPDDRTITVTTSDPGAVGPGAEVKLDIGVNRSEPVDLIVSVYDESLLGVAGDLSGSIRDHYLADARGLGAAARELAAQRVGSATVAELIAKAEALLKDAEAMSREPGLQQTLTQLAVRWKEQRLTLSDVATLVRLAGMEVYLAHPIYHSNSAVVRVTKTTRLADLLRREPAPNDPEPQYVSAVPVGNMMLLALAHRNGGDPWVYHRNPMWGQFGFQGFGGWGQFGGGGFGGGFGGNTINLNGSVQFMQGMGGFPGGQMGMSFGFNRDFMAAGNSMFSYVGGQGAVSFAPVGPSAAGPLPALGSGSDIVRRDFADSAFWTANLRTDERGKATATFKVPDSLTGWRVVVTAVSGKMHVGTGVSKFKTTRPVMVWPMLPRAFAAGDVVNVFGTVHNLTDKPQEVRVACKADNGRVVSDPETTVTVPANGSVPVYWTYRAGKPGWTDILMSAEAPGGRDASLKRLPVVQPGVVERATAAGLVGRGNLTVMLPEGLDPASASMHVTVAPTLAADMADTLPYLVEYPYGCVEQTMSRFLPAVKVAQILKRSGIALPELEKKLPQVVEAGVKRLLDLQQPDGGWGWQGTSQTHEMMTPYALYGLLEAEKAGYAIPNEHAVQNGLNRLRGFVEAMKAAWLVFEPETARPGYSPQSHPVTQVNDSLYCLWVLAHRDKVAPDWWPRIEKAAGSDKLSDYGHALALELAVKEGRHALADRLTDELHRRAQKGGDRVFWRTAGFSRWMENPFEVTAAVLKALVARDPNDVMVPEILAYFQSTKRGDRWDSTKDTAVVLYALCDYLAAAKLRRAAAGEVTLAVNDGPAQRVKLDGPLSKTVTLPGAHLKPGANTVTIRGGADAAGALARVAVRFTRGGADVPARDHGVKVTRTLSVKGADGWTDLRPGATVPKGSYVRVRVTAEAADKTALAFAVVESPKPACGETVPADDRRFAADLSPGGHVLREDREAMTCFHYEHAAGQVTAAYVFLTEFAGEFRLPPARAELMYRPTSGGHSDSFTLTVK